MDFSWQWHCRHCVVRDLGVRTTVDLAAGIGRGHGKRGVVDGSLTNVARYRGCRISIFTQMSKMVEGFDSSYVKKRKHH